MQSLRITGGFLKSRKVSFQSAETLRPTLSKTREAVFNILANYVDFENASFLDVFSGSGIMAFEAISRGFAKVFATEYDFKTFNDIKKNAKELNITPNIILGKVPKILDKVQTLNSSFDVIFIDPPYKSNLYQTTIDTISEKNLLAENGLIVMESLIDEKFDLQGFYTLKQKVYSDKLLTILKKDC